MLAREKQRMQSRDQRDSFWLVLVITSAIADLRARGTRGLCFGRGWRVLQFHWVVSERDGSRLGSEYLRFTRVRMRLRDRNTVLMWPLYRSRMNLNRWARVA